MYKMKILKTRGDDIRYFIKYRPVKTNEKTSFQKKNISINYIWVRLWDNRHIRWFVVDDKISKTPTTSEIIKKSTSMFVVRNGLINNSNVNIEKEYFRKIRLEKLKQIDESNYGNI